MTVARIALHVALPAKTLRDDKQTGPANANVKLHSTRDTRSNLVQSRAGDTRPDCPVLSDVERKPDWS